MAVVHRHRAEVFSSWTRAAPRRKSDIRPKAHAAFQSESSARPGARGSQLRPGRHFGKRPIADTARQDSRHVRGTATRSNSERANAAARRVAREIQREALACKIGHSFPRKPVTRVRMLTTARDNGSLTPSRRNKHSRLGLCRHGGAAESLSERLCANPKCLVPAAECSRVRKPSWFRC